MDISKTNRSNKLLKLMMTAGIVLLFLVIFSVKASAEERVAEGVFFEDVDVSGMTEDEVRRVIDQRLEEYRNDTITLFVNGTPMPAAAGDIGIYQANGDLVKQIMSVSKGGNVWKRYCMEEYRKNNGALIFELDMKVEPETAKALLSGYCASLNRAPVDAALVMDGNGNLVVTPKADGFHVDVDNAAAALVEYMDEGWHGGEGAIVVPVVVDYAGGDDLGYELVRDELGRGTTYYNPGEVERSANIEVGASKIDGTILMPGESFSTEHALEPFTAEAGYQEAPSIEMGSIVDTYGGGICQVSTTLYRAVLESELEVTERHEHSMLIDYVEPSMDAAISEGIKDMCFVNNTDAPIYIRAIAGSGQITFIIYGHETRDPARTIEFEGSFTEKEEFESLYILDSSIDYGTYDVEGGKDGGKAHAIKTVRVNGEVTESTEIAYSRYGKKDHVVMIGTKDAPEGAVEALSAKLDTKDIIEISTVWGIYPPLHEPEDPKTEEYKEKKKRQEQGIDTETEAQESGE